MGGNHRVESNTFLQELTPEEQHQFPNGLITLLLAPSPKGLWFGSLASPH